MFDSTTVPAEGSGTVHGEFLFRYEYSFYVKKCVADVVESII
jgi:hypothetical protein